MGLLVLLILLLITPLILMLIGFIKLVAASEPQGRSSGKRLLLIGLIWLAAEILIGYSICSNMRFGGMH